MASCRQYSKLLECNEDNFLSQVIDSPTRGHVILDCWSLTQVSSSVASRLEAGLGCSGHALVEFSVLRDKGQAKRKVRTLNFRKAEFQLFK